MLLKFALQSAVAQIEIHRLRILQKLGFEFGKLICSQLVIE